MYVTNYFFMSTENQNIKLIREALNLDQITFAKNLGLKQGSYSDIERGRIGVSTNVKEKLYKLYSVNEKWLLTGTGEMFLKDVENFDLVQESSASYNITPTNLQQTTTIMELQNYNEDELRDLIKELNSKIKILEEKVDLFLLLLQSKDSDLKSKDALIAELRESKEILKQRNECYSMIEKKDLLVNKK